ncbi:hypothetical protein L6452_18967 [Arctium lappa]|uniref:Uncharacterized protein n=1 Tax=Arctium lappa TaxID=4217 RepID=A0ACB9B7D9_ARCLA|nr:hypothetical protein L6452_18967 [Arctium lappa]
MLERHLCVLKVKVKIKVGDVLFEEGDGLYEVEDLLYEVEDLLYEDEDVVGEVEDVDILYEDEDAALSYGTVEKGWQSEMSKQFDGDKVLAN